MVGRLSLSNIGIASSFLVTAFTYRHGVVDVFGTLMWLLLQSQMFLSGLSKKSMLLGAWIAAYMLLVKFIIANKSGRLRQWVMDVQCSTNSAMVRAKSSETVNRICSSAAATSCARLLTLAGCGHTIKHEDRTLVISAAESFISVDLIATLNLVDIKRLFYYARHVNNGAFDRETFLSSLRPPARLALYLMDEVTATSRGGVPLSNSRRDMDALYYAAVLRIFAEWRYVRLIPRNSGQRYVFGMGMARRDLVQNIAKIEAAAHHWLLFHECSARQWQQENDDPSQSPIESPTIRQLLESEIKGNLHRRLPCLADQSAASGLLWSKRQLQYQTSFFEFILQVPFTYHSSKEAVYAAYKSTYDKYHGFFVRQVFHSSFEAAPSADNILLCVRSEGQVDDYSQNADMSDTDSEDNCKYLAELPIDQSVDVALRENAQDALPSNHLLQNMFDRIVKEVRIYVTQCIGHGKVQSSHHSNVLKATEHAQAKSAAINTEYVASPSTTTDIPAFVLVVKPLLLELDSLIARFNMNDPTKV